MGRLKHFMDKKTLSDLDYYTVRDEISGFCVSEEGKYSFLKTEPYTDLQKIENAKQISKEWMALLSFTVTNPLSSWPEVFEILKILKIQGSSISVSQSYFLLLSFLLVLSQNPIAYQIAGFC